MKFLNQIIQGDCVDLIAQLPDDSVNLVVTSPPYAQQRKDLYGGISEEVYPAWYTRIMEAWKPKLKSDASVLTVIRAHVNEGKLSRYVMETRLSLMDAGWNEPDELIWLKPDAPPIGSIQRPRRIYENIIWNSLSKKPYANLKAEGNFKSKRIGMEGSTRYGESVVQGMTKTKDGTSRVTDVFLANVCEIDKGVMHPAMYPTTLPIQLINTFSRKGDLIADPFGGGGTTALAAIHTRRNYTLFEISPEYVTVSKNRVEKDSKYRPSTNFYEMEEDLEEVG